MSSVSGTGLVAADTQIKTEVFLPQGMQQSELTSPGCPTFIGLTRLPGGLSFSVGLQKWEEGRGGDHGKCNKIVTSKCT